MSGTKKVGIAGKHGTRLGISIRKGLLEVQSKKTKVCPFCFKKQLKRVAKGIWECKKCGNKFAGGTHYPLMS